MEARLLVGGLAVSSAFACMFAGAFCMAAALRRRRAAMAAQGDEMSPRGLLRWLLRNGFRFASPPVRALMRIKRVREALDEAVLALAVRGFMTTRESIGTVALVAACAGSLLAGAIAGSLIAVFAALACIAAIVLAMAASAREKRHEAVREAVPDALESMAVCLGSGFTLLQTFRQVAEDVPGPLGETFARSAHVLEMGEGAEGALAELREGSHASELAFVAVALDVQHQSGGAMRQVLDAATDTVKGELALRRSLRVQTAQAKLSARVVVVMPFILVAAISLMSPGFLTPFFSGPFGYALLALALVMQVVGVLLVRRALSVEGVS